MKAEPRSFPFLRAAPCVLIALFISSAPLLNAQTRSGWLREYGTPGTRNVATGIAVDRIGNVAVCGWTTTATGGRSWLTIKYSADGVEQWSRMYGDSSTGQAVAVAFDSSGNVFVAGFIWSRASDYDIAVAKYASDGTRSWVQTYDGSAHGIDQPAAIAVDTQGNVLVAGTSDGGTTQEDFVTLSYDPAGTLRWMARSDGGNSSDEIAGLALAGDGSVCVVGTSMHTGSQAVIVTVRYDKTGNEVWKRNTTAVGVGQYAVSVACDNQGNVFVSGTAYADASTPRNTIVAYNSTSVAWNIAPTRTTSKAEYATAVAVDRAGNVLFAGASDTAGRSFGYYLVRYSQDATKLWSATYDGPVGGPDMPVAITVDGAGNAVLAGTSADSYSLTKMAMVVYDSSGHITLLHRLGARKGTRDRTVAVAVDNSGNVYMTGWEESIIRTVKNPETTVDVAETHAAPAADLWIAENSPNPFSNETVVRYGMRSGGRVTLTIHDIAGNTVATLLDEERPAGEHLLRWSGQGLPSGIYICRLSASGTSVSRQVVLLR